MGKRSDRAWQDKTIDAFLLTGLTVFILCLLTALGALLWVAVKENPIPMIVGGLGLGAIFAFWYRRM